MEEILEAIRAKEKAVKSVVLLGESGVGKSSIGNRLLGLNSATGFKESSGTDSCTKKTREISGSWVTNGTKYSIIDTPGLNDSDNEDTDHLRSIVEFLRHKEQVHSFLVVRNGHQPRMLHSFKSMLSTFELTFGEDFWHNVVIVVSSLSGYGDEPEEQSRIERWKKRIKEIFPKSANAPLETVVLDARKRDPVWFNENAEKLWKLISAMDSFECKGMKAVKSELEQVKAELARLKSLFRTKVRDF